MGIRVRCPHLSPPCPHLNRRGGAGQKPVTAGILTKCPHRPITFYQKTQEQYREEKS